MRPAQTIENYEVSFGQQDEAILTFDVEDIVLPVHAPPLSAAGSNGDRMIDEGGPVFALNEEEASNEASASSVLKNQVPAALSDPTALRLYADRIEVDLGTQTFDPTLVFPKLPAPLHDMLRVLKGMWVCGLRGEEMDLADEVGITVMP